MREGVSRWRSLMPQLAEPLAAGMAQIADLYGFSPASTVREVLSLTSERLRGRDLTLRFGAAEVRLVLEELRGAAPPLGPPIGQFGDIEADLVDVRWGNEGRLDRVAVRARNVHVQPGTPAVVVAAPVEVRAVVGQETLDQLVAAAAPRIAVELGGDTARARWVGRERLGHVEVEGRTEGDDVVLVPTAAVVGESRRLRVPPRVAPRIRIPVPDALRSGRIGEVAVAGGELVVSGSLAEWREPVTPLQLEQIIRGIRTFTGTVLSLPRTAARSDER